MPRIHRPSPPPSPASVDSVTPAAPARPAEPAAVDRFSPGAAGAPAIETIFTPGDAAKKAELALLDEIIAARKADRRTLGASENPYRIEYAIYNMTDPEVIGRLIEAARAGVKVQVLIDANQIGPHKPHNTVVNELTSAGFTHAESHKGLSAEERRDLQVIEIDMPGEGLFHFKSRYFAFPEASGRLKETLLTGSHNPQSSAHKNDESLHKITEPALIKKYVEAYRALRDGQPVRNEWSDGAAVNVLFTAPSTQGPKPVDKIFELIDQERELVFLTVFSLRNLESSRGEKLVDKLIAAKERGVPVVVVTDRKSSDGVGPDGAPSAHDADPTDELLERAGIPVYEYTNKAGPRTAMHLKSAVFGLTDMKVVTDTGNWTAATMGSGGASRGKNAESILFVDSGRYDGNATGRVYLAEFLRVMRKYADQNAGTGKPDVERLISELQASPGWPEVKVSFDLMARAMSGREVYLTGPHPALAGRDGAPGLKLDTDPGTAAFRARADVELPLGTRLEYRFARRDDSGRVEHTPGESAILVVEPTGSRADALTVGGEVG
ncbi:MAG: hypothetical protein HYZ28_02910 [Myxococcales bacterium]|nr:hypothetical protein [Myxococcales bacterium]